MTESTRQLAAIMFTDIEGYTSLMQKDEEKANLIRGTTSPDIQHHHRKSQRQNLAILW